MRTILALSVSNIILWGLFVMVFPGEHFALPGSYEHWWFDDIPWAAMFIAIAVASLYSILRLGRIVGFKNGSIFVLGITLLAILPYAAFSGGGV